MTERQGVKNFSRNTTNQKHLPYQGSDTSSVWNFCDRSVIGIELLLWFLRRHFAGKPVVVSPSDGCFLRQSC